MAAAIKKVLSLINRVHNKNKWKEIPGDTIEEIDIHKI